MEIGVDTNVLIALVENRDALRRFCLAVGAARDRVVLSELVLLELFNVAYKTAERRAEGLRELGELLLPFGVCVAESPTAMAARELDGFRWGTTPCLPGWKEAKLWWLCHAGCSELRDFVAKVPAQEAAVFGKALWLKHDRKTAEEFATREFQPKVELQRMEQNIKEGSFGAWPLELRGLTGPQVESVLSDGTRYPLHRMLSGLHTLNACAAAFKGRMPNSHHWLTSKYGDWADLSVALTLSYCSVILTRDGGLLSRLEWLYTNGWIELSSRRPEHLYPPTVTS